MLKLLTIQVLFLFVVVVKLANAQSVFAQCAGGQIDMLEYMGPANGQSFDLRYCSPNGSGSEPILVERGTVNTESGARTGFFLNKGGNYEAYFYDDSYIYFYEDISWDEQCNGQEAFYRVFTPGEGVGGKIPRCINPGSSFSSNQQIRAYFEGGYQQYTKTGNPPQGSLCSDSYGATVVSATVNYAGGQPDAPVIPGTALEDTIVMTNVGGAGTGEEKYYTRGYGLTGFRATNASGVFFESMFYKDGFSTSEPELYCSAAESGYQSSIYPEYGAEDSKYYLSPIRNLITGGSGTQRTVDKLRNELAMQGYQAYCAAEGIAIDPEYNTEDKITRYFQDGNFAGVRELTVDAIEQLNMTNAQFPIWRDISNKQFLMSSLEEYFGFRDVYINNPSAAVLTSSPINSLLSEKQLCVQGWTNLVAQQLMCEKLVDPASCELLARKIPGTEYNVSGALQLLSDYDPGYREGGAAEGCSDLTSGTTSDLGAIGQQEAQTLRRVLVNTPTYFDRAYRYGFVVAVVHTKPPGGSLDQIFNFFTRNSISGQPRDEVLVAAFKLPDVGTNKGGGDDTGSQFWNDPLDLTRKLLLPQDQNLEHENFDRDSSREIIHANALANAQQSEGHKIYCYEGTYPNGTGTTSCNNELTKAITDIINGNALDCGEAEPVSLIKDLAGLDNPAEPYGKVFNNDNGGEVLLNLFLNDETHPDLGSNGQTNPQEAETPDPLEDPANKLRSFFRLSQSNWTLRTGGTTVDFYVVYPMGFELDKVEEAMKGAFFTKSQIATLDALNTTPNFPLSGELIGLGASSDGFSYTDVIRTANGECGVEVATSGATRNIPCEEEVSVTVTQDNASVGVVGAKLGFWLRKIQTQLSSKASDAWAYFDSCQTTEEFLLGRCRGGSGGIGSGDGSGSTNPNGDELYCLAWNNLSTAQVEQYAQNTRNYLTSLEYRYTNQRPDFITILRQQTNIDWNGNTILPERLNFYENYYGGGRALLWTRNEACGGQVCFDYIMNICGSRGINPALCVGMSITETGGLNHLRFPRSYDFGCITPDTSPANIQEGLSCLIDKFFFSTTPRSDGRFVHDMNFSDMWLQFAGVEDFSSSSYTRLQDFLLELGEVGYTEGACTE